jgi:hypothetical protein
MVGLLVSGCQKKTEDADAHKISYSETTKESASRSDQQSSRDAESEESQSSSSTSSSASTSSSSSSTVASWNTVKANQLADFMVQWGQSMGQKYEAYSPTHDVNFFGANIYATMIAPGKVAVNDQRVSIAWSNDGAGSAQYKIVAMYSDAATKHDMVAHLYLFTIDSTGAPKVLITMQNQGTEDGLLHFNFTQNSALQNGFANIMIASQK